MGKSANIPSHGTRSSWTGAIHRSGGPVQIMNLQNAVDILTPANAPEEMRKRGSSGCLEQDGKHADFSSRRPPAATAAGCLTGFPAWISIGWNGISCPPSATHGQMSPSSQQPQCDTESHPQEPGDAKSPDTGTRGMASASRHAKIIRSVMTASILFQFRQVSRAFPARVVLLGCPDCLSLGSSELYLIKISEMTCTDRIWELPRFVIDDH